MAARYMASPRGRFRGASLVVAAGVFAALPAYAAERNGGHDAALRRACASGALTPYACSQRGVKMPGAAPPPSAPVQAPAPTVVKPAVAPPPPASTAAAPPAPSPTPTRADRKRARAAEATATATRPYQDTQKRYRLEIPAGWELRMQGGFASFWKGDSWIELRSVNATSVKLAAKSGLDTLRAGYGAFHTMSEGMNTYDTRAGYRMVLDATTTAGRHTSLIVIAAPLSGTDDLVILAGTSSEHAEELNEGVKVLVGSLHLN